MIEFHNKPEIIQESKCLQESLEDISPSWLLNEENKERNLTKCWVDVREIVSKSTNFEIKNMIRKLMLGDKLLEVETLDLCTMKEKFKVDWSNDIDTSESKDKQWVSEVKIYPDPEIYSEVEIEKTKT